MITITVWQAIIAVVVCVAFGYFIAARLKDASSPYNYGLNPPAPEDLILPPATKAPKSVAIPYRGRGYGYQPIFPEGFNINKLKVPTGIGRLRTSDKDNPAPNPFVKRQADRVK